MRCRIRIPALLVSLALCSLLGLASCKDASKDTKPKEAIDAKNSPQSGETKKNNTVIITDKDNGTTNKLSKGDTLQVKLEAQLGTGFGWEVVKKDDAILPAKGQPTVEKADASKPGAPEFEVYHFEAKASGTCVLEMEYKRPADKDKKSEKAYKVTIQIDDTK